MTVLEFIKNNIVLLDGATGTQMQLRGFPLGVRPESANITHREMMQEIHQSYYDAGSNIVMTNTFGVNALVYGDRELEELIENALENVRIAKGNSKGNQKKLVAFDIGPTGKLLKPYGDLDFELAVASFSKVASLAEKHGAEIIIIETMNDGYETKAALLGVKEGCNLPVFVLNAYSENERLLTGATPEAMVAMLEGMGAHAIGLNCSFGPDKMMGVAEKILACASVPVIFKPNAGMPSVVDGATVYDITPQEFASYLGKAVDMGVTIIGGCCGTSPEYISLLKDEVKNKTRKAETPKNQTVVASGAQAVVFGDVPLLIGERINPTGKKLIKQALVENNIDYLLSEGLDQQKAGANILDVNCGLPEIDEEKMLKTTVFRLQSVSSLPLMIDTSDCKAMESALRIYNGKAIINSVNGKQESLDAILPLAKRYGGVLVALTLDEKGIPETPQGRLDIALKIIEEAKKYGIDKKNIIFDPLTLTISADNNAAKVTLDSVELITQTTGCNTVLGVSNVSFGLPERDKINSIFLALAFEKGLSSAILNPMSEDMINSYRSYLALSGKDFACKNYISAMKSSESQETKPQEKAQADLKTAIVQGREELASKLTEQALKTNAPLDVINNFIIPALDEVGVEFEAKRAYLPELLLAAEAAKSCFEIIKKEYKTGEKSNGFNIVIATVKGDIHDIGKNIVKLLLENYGYNVIDLGKDVDPEKVLEAARKYKAPLVGLSALMTTTVPAMQETLELIHRELPNCKVIVGGAVLTKEYAKKIGADAYGADAMETVRYAEELKNA